MINEQEDVDGVEVVEALPNEGRIEDQAQAEPSADEDDVEHGGEGTSQQQASPSASGKLSMKSIRNLSRSDKLFIAFMAILVILAIAIPVGVLTSRQVSREEAIAQCTATYPPIAYTYTVTDEPTRAPTTSPYPSESPSLSNAPSDNPSCLRFQHCL